MDTQTLKQLLQNGKGTVSMRVFYTTLGSLIMAAFVIGGGIGSYVMAQHTSVPHPVTDTRIDDARKEVKEAVKESEQRLTAQQKSTDEKINQILFMMIQQAEAAAGRSDSQ